MATFIKAGGLTHFIIISVFTLLFTGATVATNIWLSEWSNDVVTNLTTTSTDLRLGVYGAMGILQCPFFIYQQIYLAII